MATPEDRNVTQKEADQGKKYKGLCTEVQGMSKVKCVILLRISTF